MNVTVDYEMERMISYSKLPIEEHILEVFKYAGLDTSEALQIKDPSRIKKMTIAIAASVWFITMVVGGEEFSNALEEKMIHYMKVTFEEKTWQAKYRKLVDITNKMTDVWTENLSIFSNEEIQVGGIAVACTEVLADYLIGDDGKKFSKDELFDKGIASNIEETIREIFFFAMIAKYKGKSDKGKQNRDSKVPIEERIMGATQHACQDTKEVLQIENPSRIKEMTIVIAASALFITIKVGGDDFFEPLTEKMWDLIQITFEEKSWEAKYGKLVDITNKMTSIWDENLSIFPIEEIQVGGITAACTEVLADNLIGDDGKKFSQDELFDKCIASKLEVMIKGIFFSEMIAKDN